MFDLSMVCNVGTAALRRREKTRRVRLARLAGAAGGVCQKTRVGAGALTVAASVATTSDRGPGLRDVYPGIEQNLASREVATPAAQRRLLCFRG
jgi:hypothetical protein